MVICEMGLEKYFFRYLLSSSVVFALYVHRNSIKDLYVYVEMLNIQCPQMEWKLLLADCFHLQLPTVFSTWDPNKLSPTIQPITKCDWFIFFYLRFNFLKDILETTYVYKWTHAYTHMYVYSYLYIHVTVYISCLCIH